MRLNLRKANIEKLIWPGSVNVLIAKRGSGKSFLMRDIMFHLRHIPRGVVVSGTEYVNAYYQNFIPMSYIYRHFDSAKIEEIMDAQAKLIKNAGGKKPEHQLFMILDDVLGDPATFKNNAIKRLFCDGRHFNITLFILIQDPMAIKPAFRTNVDNAFLFADNIHANIEKLWKFYCGVFKKFADFQEVFKQCTKNRETMVVKMTQNITNEIEDMIFYYKASDHPPFKTGDKYFWEHHLKLVSEQRRMKKNNSVRTIG